MRPRVAVRVGISSPLRRTGAATSARCAPALTMAVALVIAALGLAVAFVTLVDTRLMRPVATAATALRLALEMGRSWIRRQLRQLR